MHSRPQQPTHPHTLFARSYWLNPFDAGYRADSDLINRYGASQAARMQRALASHPPEHTLAGGMATNGL